MTGKKDDLRGVVEVIVPVDEINQRMFSGTVRISAVVSIAVGLGVLAMGFLSRVQGLNDETEAQSQYLSESVDAMMIEIEKFAGGDLTVSIENDQDDAIGDLYNGFSTAVAKVGELIKQLSVAVESTASSATEITASTEEISAGARQQAMQTDEVASATEEMSRTILNNSENATLTAKAAVESGKIAEEGGDVIIQTAEKIKQIADVVSESAETVEQLRQSSERIGEITSEINDIADQTNLLALNAMIEAARAGEQGRSFAVVADEVRKLAERTTLATKRITGMVKSIQDETIQATEAMRSGQREVEEGIVLANNARAALNNIVVQVETVVESIGQIAGASEEQAATSQQISQNVEAITTVFNQTAIGLAEIARSAESLNQLATDSERLVNSFQIDAKKSEATFVPESSSTALRKV